MTRKLAASSAFALALLAASATHDAKAAADADLAQIREEIRQMKDSYEARIQALESRLKEAEARAAGGAVTQARALPSAPTTQAAIAPAASASDTVAAPSAGASAGGGISAFNPAISA